MAEPDIPSVSLGQTATPEWANLVGDAIDSIDLRTTALEALTIGTRLTTAEADIDALQAANDRQGIWWRRTGAQSIAGTATAVVTNDTTQEATSGYSVSGGIVTIPAGRSGVYVVFAKVSSSGFFSAAWITVDDNFDVSLVGGSDRGGTGHFTGTASLRLNAGQNVRVYVRNPSASAVNVTSAHVHLWRVSA
jgi:hypothetical protein